MEITTREEVHLLGYFSTLKAINDFQKFLDSHLENTDNPKIFEEQGEEVFRELETLALFEIEPKDALVLSVGAARP